LLYEPSGFVQKKENFFTMHSSLPFIITNLFFAKQRRRPQVKRIFFSERSLFCSSGRFYALWDIKKASGKPKRHTLT
jgi:alpha-glucosidase (family GH31 glycosyl hydrolase)